MSNTDNLEIRRVQGLQGERSFTLVLPKEFAVRLGIGKGDFLKCRVDGHRLVLEKVDRSYE
jgi:bifunctional DNA-binding transcriptional regulator/antitoxin component of YhaV-PrlF toxin-antitoxin module